MPGIRSASASTGMPVRGTSFGMPFYIVGKPVDDPSRRPGAGFNMVSPDYFLTFGIQVLRGRGFSESDRLGTQPVALVNETFAKRYFADVDPLDAAHRRRAADPRRRPGSVRRSNGRSSASIATSATAGRAIAGFPEIDVPLAQSPWPGVGIAVRTAGEPASVQRASPTRSRRSIPTCRWSTVRTMEQIVDQSIAPDRFRTRALRQLRRPLRCCSRPSASTA